ncbi:Inner membrane protein yhaI [Cedecea neteri]|uniref:DUF805 domain-containing protein n=1 Tax=Cedecea neteri TaxID=158822 RepID=A0A291E4I3_9ENTR|nr:DUF805 domain-containing protein [Cedecea neteri]ATF94853.1 DUF805 domain-containing protein [Cedecea neteri]SQA98448.1 Inner membrane protein yhaI [Cedecea neteri]
MTIQQWLFSFKGRIGRRDFWIWIGAWIVGLIILFTLAGAEIMPYSTAGFFLSGSLIPTAAVIVKRLHDRDKKGWWALLFIPAWLLVAGNWETFGTLWQWGLGRFIPTLIFVMVLMDLGAFVGTQGENRFGKETSEVKFR